MLIYFCYFIDVNHMHMSDGTNKTTTTTTTTKWALGMNVEGWEQLFW